MASLCIRYINEVKYGGQLDGLLIKPESWQNGPWCGRH